MRFGMHVDADFSALPGVADFTKALGDQAQQPSNIWKDSDDSGPSFELLIDSLDHVAGAHFRRFIILAVKRDGFGSPQTEKRRGCETNSRNFTKAKATE